MIIVIAGIVVIATAIFFSVVLYSINRHLSAILKAARRSALRIDGVTALVGEEIARPIAQAAAVAGGVAVGINGLKKVFKRGARK